MRVCDVIINDETKQTCNERAVQSVVIKFDTDQLTELTSPHNYQSVDLCDKHWRIYEQNRRVVKENRL